MKNLCALIIIAVLATGVSAARVNSLFSDRVAVRQGDILTVVIVENAEANARSSTNTRKSNSMRMGVSPLRTRWGNPLGQGIGVDGRVGHEFDGQGSTNRAGRFVATISARVDQVLDNGNLMISGNRVVEINEEKEIINISGIVRPQDIERNNTVLSSNIANAQITYSGTGSASSAQRQGPIARFFNWLF